MTTDDDRCVSQQPKLAWTNLTWRYVDIFGPKEPVRYITAPFIKRVAGALGNLVIKRRHQGP